MIVITGATGALNGATADALLETVPAERIAVVTRDVARAERFAARGVEVRRGDYADPDSLPAAFADAEQLLLVSSNDPHADAVELHRAAIDAARAAGAGRILYTSHQGAGAGSPFAPARVHAATEAILAASGVPWTSLRNGFYASSSLVMMGEGWKHTGRLDAPADGKVSWTAHADLAEAAAAILASEGRHEGPTPPLTGSAALDFADLAAVVSGLTGKPVQRQTVTDEAFEATLRTRGLPPPVVSISMGFYRASRHGEFAAVDPTLERLIGHRPTDVREVLAGALRG